MSPHGVRPFPLVPRRRFRGIHPGSLRTPQRGEGDETAGSRPYRPGDRLSWIDWRASARLSAARGSDELVVREFFAQRAPRAVVVSDGRPSLGIYRGPLPWLDKPAAIAAVVELVTASARAAHGDVGLVAWDATGPVYVPPGRAPSSAWLVDRATGHVDAPPDALARSLELLTRRRAAIPVGSFVFVVSDFLEQPSKDEWLWALERRWEIVPVVVQDPVWEQSFPDVGGAVVPLADPAGGGVDLVRIPAAETASRRSENEARLARLLFELRALGLDPVVVSSHDHRDVVLSFLGWADERLFTRGRA